MYYHPTCMVFDRHTEKADSKNKRQTKTIRLNEEGTERNEIINGTLFIAFFIFCVIVYLALFISFDVLKLHEQLFPIRSTS